MSDDIPGAPSQPDESESQTVTPGLKANFLSLSVFIVATVGLVYELIAGTLASYLLGDSVLQFSTVIGDYLFAMGVGSYLAQYFSRRDSLLGFVRLQILIGLVGGCSAACMHLAFGYTGGFRPVLYSLVFIVGTLVGIEIPLLMDILKKHYGFRELVSQVLGLDYIGALLASLLFPLVLVPNLGVMRTSFLCGILNILVALSFFHSFPRLFKVYRAVFIEGILVLLVLVCGLAYSDDLTTMAEEALFPDPVIFSRSTSYQRLVVTRHNVDTRLYLNGNLQFSSMDEYRYHEALVHPALTSHPKPSQVLVLGGGDGLAVREILKDKRVEKVTLVDLDPGMTKLFSSHSLLSALNDHSLTQPRVNVINGDAFIWLKSGAEKYDVVIVDFPDPSNYSVGKLYTTAFYRTLRQRLQPGAVISIQSTSPLFARRSYWCIANTVKASGFQIRPYHVYVPSFGEWGYILASTDRVPVPNASLLPSGLRFLGVSQMSFLFDFPADMSDTPADINHLFDQVLVRYYDRDWRKVVE